MAIISIARGMVEDPQEHKFSYLTIPLAFMIQAEEAFITHDDETIQNPDERRDLIYAEIQLGLHQFFQNHGITTIGFDTAHNITRIGFSEDNLPALHEYNRILDSPELCTKFTDDLERHLRHILDMSPMPFQGRSDSGSTRIR